MTLTTLEFFLYAPIVLAIIACLALNKKLKKVGYPALNRVTVNINIVFLLAIISTSLYRFIISGLLHPPFSFDFETIFPFVFLILAILLCVFSILACLINSRKDIQKIALTFNVIAGLNQIGVLLFVLSADMEELMRNTEYEGFPIAAGGVAMGIIVISSPIFWNIYAIIRLLAKTKN